MTILPEYLDGNAYISIRSLGSIEGAHEQVVDLLFASKLMSKALEDAKTPKVVVSTDSAENAKPSAWFTFREGKLIPTEKAFVLARKFQGRVGTTLSVLLSLKGGISSHRPVSPACLPTQN